MKIHLNTLYIVTRSNADNSINIGDSLSIHKERSGLIRGTYQVIIPHVYKNNIHNQVFYFKDSKDLTDFIQPLELELDKEHCMQQIQQLKKRIIKIKRMCYEVSVDNL